MGNVTAHFAKKKSRRNINKNSCENRPPSLMPNIMKTNGKRFVLTIILKFWIKSFHLITECFRMDYAVCKGNYQGCGGGRWMIMVLLWSVIHPILVAILIWIGEPRGFPGVFWKQHICDRYTKCFCENSLFRATMLFVMQIVVECGLAVWRNW